MSPFFLLFNMRSVGLGRLVTRFVVDGVFHVVNTGAYFIGGNRYFLVPCKRT